MISALRYRLSVLLFQAVVACALVAAAGTARAAEDWRERLGLFRVGFIAASSSDPAPDIVAEVERRLSDAVEMPVRLVAFRTFAAMIDAHTTGRIAYGVYSAQAFAAAQAVCACLVPLVAPKDASGHGGQRAMVLAKPGLFGAPADFAGHVLAWPDSPTLATLLAADFTVLGAAISGNEPFVAKVADPAAALADGRADAALVTVPARDGDDLSGAGGRDILWRSAFWRFGPHAVSTDVGEDGRNALRDLLLAITDPDDAVITLFNERLAGGYAAAETADYRAVAATIARIADQ